MKTNELGEGASLMATEDKSQVPPLSSEDEKEAQRESDRLGEKQNGAFNTTHKRTGFEDKSLWDKLNVLGTLAIPLIIALATIGFGLLQVHLTELQHQNDIQLADDQQQEATLKAYLDDMTTLLLDKKLGSQDQGALTASAQAAVIARAKTLTALRRLTNPQRKATVVQFLYQSQLIGYYDFTKKSLH